MGSSKKKISAGGAMMLFLVLLTAVALEEAFVSGPKWYNILYVTLPLLLLVFLASRRKKPGTASTAQD